MAKNDTKVGACLCKTFFYTLSLANTLMRWYGIAALRDLYKDSFQFPLKYKNRKVLLVTAYSDGIIHVKGRSYIWVLPLKLSEFERLKL